MGISEKIAYLKGLMEGMNVDTESNEGKLFAAVVDVLDEIALEVEDLTDEVMELGDGLDVISDDLSDVEDIVYDEWDDDDDDDDEEDEEEECYATTCPECEEEIFFDDTMLEDGEIICPNCGAKLEFDLSDLADAADGGDQLIGKSEQEITDQELELGPRIAGRVLGAAPLIADPAAQRRVNLIGRWLASRTSRPDLPWTFGIIDSDEVNAFAAPGGYVLITRGLYQLLADDAEVAAVLGHELSHVVQRDHYDVVRKQETQGALGKMGMKRVKAGGVAGSLAKDYVAKHGAAVMMTKLDRDAEFRADEAAGIYLARGGSNPLALYSVLQKMTALGASSPALAQLYRTHPALDTRMDRIDQRAYAGLEAYTRR